MATSGAEDVPRTLDFLFLRNRLNVAVSRAMCLASIVASRACALAPQRRRFSHEEYLGTGAAVGTAGATKSMAVPPPVSP